MKKVNLILLGSTDLTYEIAKKLKNIVNLVGLCSAKPKFKISYAKNFMLNARHIDMEKFAKEIGIFHHTYSDIDSLYKFTQLIKPDILIAAGWHHYLNKEFLNKIKIPAIGIHASLLPKFRGAAPLNWAILNNEKKTGVSMFFLEKGIDSGQIIDQKGFEVLESDYIYDLVKKTEKASIDMLISFFKKQKISNIKTVKQIGQPTYSLARFPENGLINWENTSSFILRLIRATSKPYPGAFTFKNKKKIIIWSAKMEETVEVFGSVGQICYNTNLKRVIVVCKEGSIEITEATFENGDNALDDLRKLNNQFFD
jgi:methionyl-tRNA formyltransferase